MKLTFTSQDVDKIQTELILLMHFEGEVPLKNMLGKLDWRINGRLSRFVQNEQFLGQAKELLLMPGENRFKAKEILVLGLGKRENFHQDHISQVLDFLFTTLKKKGTEQACLSLYHLQPSEFDWRNAVRLLLTKWLDFKDVQEIILCEPSTLIRDIKRRQIDFGHQVKVEYM
jgi:leucyl aminopeptidase